MTSTTSMRYFLFPEGVLGPVKIAFPADETTVEYLKFERMPEGRQVICHYMAEHQSAMGYIVDPTRPVPMVQREYWLCTAHATPTVNMREYVHVATVDGYVNNRVDNAPNGYNVLHIFERITD